MSGLRLGLVVAMVALLSACSEVDQAAEEVEKALGVEAEGFPPPAGVRPCCLLGADMRVRLEGVEIPGYRERFATGPEKLGAHGYGAGFLAHDTTAGIFSLENNGLIYTCTSGFIDTAHIRDNADLTVFLAHEIEPILASGGTVQLPDQGGARSVELSAVDPELISKVGSRPIAAGIAAWAAYQFSVWHEIATGYGWASTPAFPEYDSSFSPEDLVSNLTGIEIAYELLVTGRADTRADYEAAMDTAIQAVLKELIGFPEPLNHEALDVVDGLWWDSNAPIPDPKLLRRRHFEFQDEIAPWAIPESQLSDKLRTEIQTRCGTLTPALVLRRPHSKVGTQPIDSLTTVEIDTAEFAQPFPYPNPGSKLVDHDDFTALTAELRRRAKELLGDDADQP
jgi:hypothetical protein